MITLHGGPRNGQECPDLGMVDLRMGVWRNNGKMSLSPSDGALTGISTYELDDERENAYFLETEWGGRSKGIY